MPIEPSWVIYAFGAAVILLLGFIVIAMGSIYSKLEDIHYVHGNILEEIKRLNEATSAIRGSIPDHD